ncbi:MAG: hypothetical protein KJO46_00705, partial [Gammaproteobacteria bacterium]|nr:hypothetical protein [Gammaproteobacteria bacterium]
MQITPTFKILATGLLAGCLIAGCVAPAELIAKSADAPAGTNLSGVWRLRQEPGAERKAPADRDLTIRIPRESSVGRNSREVRSWRSSAGPSAGLFLENGKLLKITQTKQGLFISFDRAIVEEYTFGEKRTVTIGPIEAQRVSGWEDSHFVVETLDDTGAVLTESWRLED